jgi:hypothetical protein
MPSFTVRVGVILVVFGGASYVTSGGASWTALIPAIFGALLALCGVVAMRRPSARPHAMHAAALLAFVGLGATMAALPQLPAIVSGAPVPRRPAVIARASMALILLVYLAVSVKSFVDARLRRKA